MTIDDAFDGITDSVFIFPNKHKAPKSARATDHVAPPSRNCKGICDRIAVGKPHKGFKVAAFCARCGNGSTNDGVWIMLKDLVPSEKRGLVCPCCNFRPRQKRTKNKNKI